MQGTLHNKADVRTIVKMVDCNHMVFRIKRVFRGCPTDREYQEYLSNRPTVLLSKGSGIERIGKRDAERSISGIYVRAKRK